MPLASSRPPGGLGQGIWSSHLKSLFLLLRLVAFSSILILSACGGGSGADFSRSTSGQSDGQDVSPSFLPTSDAPPSAKTTAALQEGARLNSAELEQIAKTGVISKAHEGTLLSGVAKDVVVGEPGANGRVPIYRFFNSRTTAHFFTTSETERDNVIATLPFMTFEGSAFYASAASIPGLSPVHRFYNTQTGVHFYTISESERALIASTLPHFTYEGIAYYASTLEGSGYTPLYRFFYTAKGFHFYTNSLSERNNIIATLPQYHYEGVGYYVLGNDWKTPAIPHTGVPNSQCYQAGSDVLMDCNSDSAQGLNPQQDGHRTASHPMSYNGVPIFAGESAVYSSTECVKDNVTGLIWEGKTATGTRAGSTLYSYVGSNAPTDASGYVNLVNNMALCGYGDWRLPTVEELQGIVNFGLVGGGPKITTSRFPNTMAADYWAGGSYSGNASQAWVVGFATGYRYRAERSSPHHVRLVRGAQWSGPRYVYMSIPFTGDAENNTVVDRKTGLVWRRCLYGESWSGTACTGTWTTQTHETALSYAKRSINWRLPNAKELASLVDLSTDSPALDNTVFPGALSRSVWSSTPLLSDPSSAWYTDFGYGWGLQSPRGVRSANGIRLLFSGGVVLQPV
jgi:hypothetical protein